MKASGAGRHRGVCDTGKRSSASRTIALLRASVHRLTWLLRFSVEEEHAECRSVARPHGVDVPSTSLGERLKCVGPILVGILSMDGLPLRECDRAVTNLRPLIAP